MRWDALADFGKGNQGDSGPVARRARRRDHGGVQPKSPRACTVARLQYQARASPIRLCHQKKRIRPLEQLRPDIKAKRTAFLEEVRLIPTQCLVFLDESGLNHSMTRSHVWVKRGTEFIERTPVNWGKNLTLLGAIRLEGWVVQSSMFQTTNGDRFVSWLRGKLLPKLRRGDVLVMDNLRAHHDPRVEPACQAHGVRALYLPPYSPDFNPIEPGWALQKQFVRKHAPRGPVELRRVACRARYRVTRRHCRAWFAHAGYPVVDDRAVTLGGGVTAG